MEKIIIVALLLIIILQLHLHLRRSLKINQLLADIKYGLFGGGSGAMSKLSYLESIYTNLEKLIKKYEK